VGDQRRVEGEGEVFGEFTPQHRSGPWRRPSGPRGRG
jgi:hypothetical protein